MSAHREGSRSRQAPFLGRLHVHEKERALLRGSMLQAFVMADTTYNSLGVDEVAAQHVNAQCVVSPPKTLLA